MEPIGDLFDGGLFKVVGKSGLAGARGGGGEDVSAGVCDSALVAPRTETRPEGNDAGVADEVVDAGLFDPALDFGGFEFEFGDRLQGEAGEDEFGFVGGELLAGADRSGEGAVCDVVEAGADGFDCAGEEGVVGAHRDSEPIFDRGQWS